MRQMVIAVLMLGATVTLSAGGREVVVNDVVLSNRTVQQLEFAFSTKIQPDAYWYDSVSGLWGRQGGPSIGQLPPHLKLGGPLRADASLGNTGVFVNGRQLHQTEVQALIQRFGSVTPGRYWMNASFVGGFENGPAVFDLRARQRGPAGYNRQTLGGGLMSDGACAGYLHPDGPTVMTGNC